MKKYYKVFIYSDWKSYIPIDETELEKAIGAFRLGAPVVFNEGATEKIREILPDFNRIMGWNDGYTPTAEDSGYIANDRTCLEARKLFGETNVKVDLLIQNERQDLIGKGLPLPEVQKLLA